MKAKTAKTATAAVVSIVREAGNIESMFKPNSLGYLESGKASNDISVEDSVGYVVSKLESGQSAVREAILFSGWLFKTKPEEDGKAFADKLKERWTGSTVPNLISISKSLGLFESKGLSIANVRDLYGLRECSKLLKGDETSKQAVALLNKGESPRNVKEKLNPKAEREEREESPAESESLADKEGIASTLVLTYVERFAILADSETRLKLARQIISKLALGNYILASTDAHKAIQEIKAKK
jgi:glycine cleavage system H lipoate-binding protein